MFKKRDAEGKGSYDRLNERERKVNGSEKISFVRSFSEVGPFDQLKYDVFAAFF